MRSLAQGRSAMSAERTDCPCWNDPNPPPGATCKFCKRVAPGERPAHTCHARGCSRAVKPELLMCATHWRQVPGTIQRAVWRTYRRGQCDDMNPSDAWHAAADAAIGYVARMEGQPVREVERAALERYVPAASPLSPVKGGGPCL